MYSSLISSGKCAFLCTNAKCNSCGKVENRIVWATFSCYYDLFVLKKVTFGGNVCPSVCDFVSAPEPNRFF